MRRRVPCLLSLSLSLGLVWPAACSVPGGDNREVLTVLAAASLTEVSRTLASDFEADRPDVRVEFSFGSSTDLAQQAADGAPGDVLATADEESMQIAVEAGVVDGEPVTFAENSMVLVTPPDDPAGIGGLDDLGGTDWVRCADEVPCGRVALALLAAADVTAEPVSVEEDVKSALEKVATGEADAGLVYATDAVAAGEAVRTVPLPGADAEWTPYLAAALDQSDHPELAARWLRFLASGPARAALAEAGFSTP